MSTLSVNNVAEVGGAPVVTNGVLDSGSLPTGTILQVVHASTTSSLSTTSATFTDAGLSISITPSSTSSKILLICNANAQIQDNLTYVFAAFRLTDSADVVVGGVDSMQTSLFDSTSSVINEQYIPINMFAYDSPGSTASKTYKLQFRTITGASVNLRADRVDPQLIAIEVAG